MNDLLRVDATWEELGFKMRSVGTVVFVRTDPLPEKTPGGVVIPPSLSDLYGQRLGSKVHLTGTVLSASRTKGYGAKSPVTIPSKLKPGDKILFTRFEFGWLWKMKDGTHVGFIKEPLILASVTEGESSAETDARLETA